MTAAGGAPPGGAAGQHPTAGKPSMRPLADDPLGFEALRSRALDVRSILAERGGSTSCRVRWAVRERLRFGVDTLEPGEIRALANLVLDLLDRSDLSSEQTDELERIVLAR